MEKKEVLSLEGKEELDDLGELMKDSVGSYVFLKLCIKATSFS
ncbi:MAG: hypothetical protein ACR5K5_05470 [Wolbachia sp.]